MKLWHLLSTRDSEGGHVPRVLFSTPEARGVRLDLAIDETLGDHTVRERSILTVLSGRVQITAGAQSAPCEAGTVVLLEPAENHRITAVEASCLLLVLAPWPAPGHYAQGELSDPHELPAHAAQAPG
jgi:quercetin dioxygenase-like cupin family protein